MTLIKELSMLPGISGDEGAVRQAIIEKIKDHCSYTVDPMGNLICEKKGKRPTTKKVLLAAHMDEVGMIVTAITEQGYLQFDTVGGIESKVLLGRAVRLYRTGVVGVIGTKAVHEQRAEEKGKAVAVSKLVIDIGAKDKADAEAWVRAGDGVVFESAFVPFGDGFVKGKALDDRVGCALLIELLQQPAETDFTVAFTVQEEVGLRGAKTAAYTVNPDVAIVLETTTAADIAGVSGQERVCTLQKGAVVGFMDRATIYPRSLYQLAQKIAKEKDIAIQTKSMVAGGNDSGAIHQSRGGVPTLAISLPCRYLHTATCVIHKDDYKAVWDLMTAMLPTLANGSYQTEN